MSPERLLRWYPPAWRDRYGEEFLALVEDTIGPGRSAPVTLAVEVVFAGIVERARAAGLVGRSASRGTRRRIGTLVVLWAWAAFVVAGSAFAKRTEHAPGEDLVGAVRGLAGIAAVAVTVGLAASVPTVLRYLRRGGWSAVQAHVVRASVAVVVAAVCTWGLATWAASIPGVQREEGSGWYAVAFVGWACSVVVAILFCTGAGFAVARRLPLDGRLAVGAALLATLVALLMAAMTAVTIVWWARQPSAAADVGWIVAAMAAADLVAAGGLTRTWSSG